MCQGSAGSRSTATSLAAWQFVCNRQECCSGAVWVRVAGERVILDAADGARGGGQLTLVLGPGEVDRELTLSGVSDQMSAFDLDPAESAQACWMSDEDVLGHEWR